MANIILRRLIATIPVLFGASIVIFLLIRLVPGDPAIAIGGPDASDEDLEQIRISMRLNDSLAVQYWRFVSGAVQGDLGRSYYYKRDIVDMVTSTLPATIQLGLTALFIFGHDLDSDRRCFRRLPQFVDRSNEHGRLGPRCLHSGLLAGHHADLHIRGAVALVTRVRPRRFLFLAGRVATHPPAGGKPRRHHDGKHLPFDPQFDARCFGR